MSKKEVGAGFTIRSQAAIGCELRRTCSTLPAPLPASSAPHNELEPRQQQRELSLFTVSFFFSSPGSRRNRTAAAMSARARAVVWLQLAAACLVLGVNGKWPLGLRFPNRCRLLLKLSRALKLLSATRRKFCGFFFVCLFCLLCFPPQFHKCVCVTKVTGCTRSLLTQLLLLLLFSDVTSLWLKRDVICKKSRVVVDAVCRVL